MSPYVGAIGHLDLVVEHMPSSNRRSEATSTPMIRATDYMLHYDFSNIGFDSGVEVATQWTFEN